MSDLKNIFYGDKVVQQAYLNDALIYQADGWENTPSTKQLTYTSSLPLLRKTRKGVKAMFNSKNEMIVVDAQLKSVGGTNYYYYRISKIDSDTGTLIYSTDSEVAGLIKTETAYVYDYGVSYPDEEFMYLDKNDTIHVVYNRQIGSSSTYAIFLLNITDTGKDFSIETIQLDTSVASGSLYTVAFDDNYFYMSILLNSHYIVKAVNYTATDMHEMITPTSWQITSLGTYTDSVYLYGYAKSSLQVVQFNKYTWTSKILDMSYKPNSGYDYNMYVDKMNNLYFYTPYRDRWGTGDRVTKYSTVNKTTTTFKLYNKNYAQVYHLALDSKYNLYVFCNDMYTTTNNVNYTGQMCYKVSPSMNYEWFATEFININSEGQNIGTVCVDNYDSIYVLLPIAMTSNTGDFAYRIYKYNNLEQVKNG